MPQRRGKWYWWRSLRSLWLEQKDSTQKTLASLAGFHTPHRLLSLVHDFFCKLKTHLKAGRVTPLPLLSAHTSIYLDAFRAGLLQQFDCPRVRRFLTSAVVPGQVAASGATRQLVAQLLSRHRVLQGGTAKTEAGRRCERRKRRGGKQTKRWMNRLALWIVFEIVCHADCLWSERLAQKKKHK